MYARSKDKVRFERLRPVLEKGQKNLDNDPRGAWTSADFTAQGWRPNQMYKIVTLGGKAYFPPPGRCWGNVEPEFFKLLAENRMWFGKLQTSRPRVKNFMLEGDGISSWTWWDNKGVGHNQESKKEIIELFGADSAFDTPKPERLLERVLQIASGRNDLVLDSFLGSGTTAAVAHKMGRRYIGIEMGEHAVTHCAPRLKKVVGGEQGGISEAVGWHGGGGFRFYRLGSPVFDEQGHIHPSIRFDHLAAHIWFAETRTPMRPKRKRSPLLGKHGETAYYLLYNGILGDKRPDGGNVLTRRILEKLPAHDGPKVIYGESSRLSAATMKQLGIVFKQTPYDVKAR